MKTVKLFMTLLLVILFSSKVFGFAHVAHEKTIIQALDLLQKGDEKQRWMYGYFVYHGQRNGTSPQRTIAAMGPRPDDFLDTVIGGWWVGYRYFVEVDLIDTHMNFTSYSHFTSTFRPGKNGDRYVGYAFPYAPSDGFFGLNRVLKTLLHNQEVKSGSFENAKGLVLGLKDIFQVFTKNWMGLASDFYMGERGGADTWGLPGAPNVLLDYQTQTSSTVEAENGANKPGGGGEWRIPKSNWEDIQDTYFSPGANSGQYWYNQFSHSAKFDSMSKEDLETLGYAMHWVADAAMPVHVWSTTGHNHVDFEHYIDDNINKGYKANKDLVQTYINQFYNTTTTTYPQVFAAGAKDTPTSGVSTATKKEVSIKDLKVNGKPDPTLYSVGDILRWLSEIAVDNNKIMTDTSDKVYIPAQEKTMALAVAGEILVMEKVTADLYKKKQYERLVSASNPATIWGYGKFEVAGTWYNQIR